MLFHVEVQLSQKHQIWRKDNYKSGKAKNFLHPWFAHVVVADFTNFLVLHAIWIAHLLSHRKGSHSNNLPSLDRISGLCTPLRAYKFDTLKEWKISFETK